MPLEARVLTGLSLALAVVYWATPVAIRVADRLQFHDVPAGYKGHARPTPYLGGAAVITGFVATVLLLATDWERTLPLVGAVVALWAVGTLDDRRTVAWWLRVALEAALGAGLWAAGLGWELGLGAGADAALSAVWVVGVVNAFNLFDNMDGQAATMGMVTAAALALLGVVAGDEWLAVAGAALAGACVGFLPHNLLAQPARIFLGDGGSMPLGLAVAVLAMTGASGAAASGHALALGLLLVGIPALDVALVVYSRRRRGVSFLTGGRDHLTHRARRRLRTALAVAVALGGAQVVLSLVAIVAARGSAAALSGIAVLYLVAMAAAVALIDARLPVTGPEAAGEPARPEPEPEPAPERRRVPAEAPVLALLGAGAGISPLFGGYYDAPVWGAIGLGLLALLLAAGIARPDLPRGSAAVAVAALAALGGWALASALWADSASQAMVEANRILVMAALLAAAVVLLRDARGALWALGGFAAAAAAVTAWQVTRLLGPDAADSFLGGRLHEPLGYANAQASFAVLLMWPLVALAEQRRSALAAGAGLAGAVVCAGLVLLAQSRGAALALVASALLVLAVCPGRLRRSGLLAVGGAAVAAAAGALLDAGAADGAAINAAVGGLLAAAAGAGALWAAIVAAERHAADGTRRRARTAAAAAAAVAAVVALGAVALSADRLATEVREQRDAFVSLGPAAADGERSRLVSGAGNRHDYWRIAVNTWQDRPLLGTGAGGYGQPYLLQRRTTEDVRQPHSLALQQLAELGLPGLALALVVLGAAGWGARRARAAARTSRLERGLLVAALGTAGAWAVHAQVDWIHLLPGLTAAALLAAAVLLRRDLAPAPPARPRRPPRRRALIAALLVAPVAVAAVSVARQLVAQHHRGGAEAALAAGQPREALERAGRALRLDPDDGPSRYARAAAFARTGDAAGAEAELREAAAREPGAFLPHALLGDLAVRRGATAEARAHYRDALARNPREPSLRAALAGLEETR